MLGSRASGKLRTKHCFGCEECFTYKPITKLHRIIFDWLEKNNIVWEYYQWLLETRPKRKRVVGPNAGQELCEHKESVPDTLGFKCVACGLVRGRY